VIQFNFTVANPFQHESFKDYWQKDFALTKNKTFELGFYRYTWNLFEFQLDLRWRGVDHAGPSLEIGLFGYTARIGISDNRHWNYDTNDWEIHEDRIL